MDPYQQFLKACKEGVISNIDTLMNHPDVVAKISQGNFEFISYISRSPKKIELLKHVLKIDIIKANLAQHGAKALLMGVKCGKEIFRQLFDISEVRDSATANYNEALVQAASYGHTEIFQMLWKLPEVIEYDPQMYGNRALVNAAYASNKEIFELLWNIPKIKSGAADNDNAALVAAAQSGNIEIFKLLWEIPEVKAKAAANDNAALVAAALSGNTEIFQLLWEMPEIKANAAANDNAALLEAVKSDNAEIFKLLWEMPEVKTNAAANNNAALVEAAQRGNKEIFELLWKIEQVRDNATADDNSALSRAVFNGHTEIVQELLKIEVVRNKAVEQTYDYLKDCDDAMVQVLLAIPEIKDKTMKSLEKAIADSDIRFINRLIAIPEIKAKVETMLYVGSLPEISSMIFTKARETEKIATRKEQDSYASGKIIYNNDQYNIAASDLGERGNPLLVEGSAGDTVGYNIHLPPPDVPIKNILVQVYGGGGTKREPGGLSEIDKKLRSEGTVIVSLNTPDLIKLNNYQMNMPRSLHAEIHAAIHQFYMTVKSNPGALHADLSALDLENIKIYLYGSSFGGLMSIRHAELYPGTFSGYISHNGVLSVRMHHQSDRVGSRPMAERWLDPAQASEVLKIADPLLLLQNRDDNNVNAKVVFDFYERLSKAGKAPLARLGVFEVSSPIPTMENHGFTEKVHKGHFIPESEEEFHKFASMQSTFMQDGVSKIPEISRWRSTSQDILANKFFKAANTNEKFLAEVHEKARFDKVLAVKLSELGNSKSVQDDTLFQTYLKPLYYAIYWVDKLSDDQPILEQELKRLTMQGLPTNEMLKKALLSQADVVIPYMKEAFGYDWSLDTLTSDDMVKILREKLINIANDDTRTKNFLLSSLYQSNPELLNPLHTQFEKDEKCKESFDKAIDSLKKVRLEKRKQVKQVWKSAAKQVLLKEHQLKKSQGQILEHQQKLTTAVLPSVDVATITPTLDSPKVEDTIQDENTQTQPKEVKDLKSRPKPLVLRDRNTDKAAEDLSITTIDKSIKPGVVLSDENVNPRQVPLSQHQITQNKDKKVKSLVHYHQTEIKKHAKSREAPKMTDRSGPKKPK